MVPPYIANLLDPFGVLDHGEHLEPTGVVARVPSCYNRRADRRSDGKEGIIVEDRRADPPRFCQAFATQRRAT